MDNTAVRRTLPVLRLENVSKIFGVRRGADVPAVNKVTLDIMPGDVYGIIGYSGAGKSTLVRCMNLLERPSEGKIYFDGTELTALKAAELRGYRRKMGMIFQLFNLMPSRTVYDNVSFALYKSPLSKEEKDKKVRSLLELVDIPEKADAYPSQLSGGQKQRVAIARALANDPKVLLCDEATSALDPQSTRSILALLKKLNSELGLTVVIITHSMSVVKEICRKVAVMEDGYVVEQGDVYDVFANPSARITKEFLRAEAGTGKIEELIEKGSPVVRLKEGEHIVRFTYSGNTVSEALISTASRKFGVDFNILSGNVDIISDKPLGVLLVLIGGNTGNIEAALEYFKINGVDTEVIK